MDVHYDGGVFRLGLVEEAWYLMVVEAGIAHDPWLAEAAGRDAGRRGAGKAPRIAVGQVDDPDVGVALRGREGEDEPSRVGRELEAAHDAFRYLRVRHPSPPAVEEQHVRVAVHVAARDEVAAVLRKLDALDVPVVRGEVLHLRRR